VVWTAGYFLAQPYGSMLGQALNQSMLPDSFSAASPLQNCRKFQRYVMREDRE